MGISYTFLVVDCRFQGAGTPRKKVAMSSCVCMTHSEEPSRANIIPIIHLAILRPEILPICERLAYHIMCITWVRPGTFEKVDRFFGVLTKCCKDN